jgi:hypothetical protein
VEASHVAVRIDPTQKPAFAHGLSLEMVAKLTLKVRAMSRITYFNGREI